VTETPAAPASSSAPGIRARESRSGRAVALACGLALALPTLLAGYLPMTDLPMHEGVVGVLRHLRDPAYFPTDPYVLNLGHPNQLFYLVAWALSFVTSTAMACKLVVAGSQIGLFVAGDRLARHLGRTSWAAALLTPLALGFTYYFGLVTNLLGLALFFSALPTFDLAARHPSARGALGSSAALLLLFFAHESVFAAGAAVVGILAVLQPLRRTTVTKLLPAFLATALAVAHQLWSAASHTAWAGESSATTFLPIRQKVVLLPNVLFGSHDLVAQLALSGVALAALGALAWARRRERIGTGTTTVSDDDDAGVIDTFAPRRRLFADRFVVVGVVFLLGYFVLPFTWGGSSMLHERFLGPAWGVLAIALAPRAAPARILKLVLAVVPTGALLLAWPQFLDASTTHRQVDELLAQVPTGSSVVSCVVQTPPARTRIFSASLAPSRSLASRGGRAAPSLLISTLSPVQIRPAYRWDETDVRLVYSNGRALQPAADLRRFGYLVVQVHDDDAQRLVVQALAPDAELVDGRREWLLLRSRHRPLPLASPDLPADLQDDAGPIGRETLPARMTYLQRRMAP